MIPEYTDDDEEYLDGVDKWLNLLYENKQYFYITHPARKSEELQLFYNSLGKYQIQSRHKKSSSR